MTILGMTFEQAAFSFGWVELVNFSNHLPYGSATYRALHPDEYRFSTDLQRSAILADISDELMAFMYAYSTRNGGKPKRPRPYPRPWADDGSQRIGKDPIPISEFNNWYYGGD